MDGEDIVGKKLHKYHFEIVDLKYYLGAVEVAWTKLDLHLHDVIKN